MVRVLGKGDLEKKWAMISSMKEKLSGGEGILKAKQTMTGG